MRVPIVFLYCAQSLRVSILVVTVIVVEVIQNAHSPLLGSHRPVHSIFAINHKRRTQAQPPPSQPCLTFFPSSTFIFHIHLSLSPLPQYHKPSTFFFPAPYLFISKTKNHIKHRHLPQAQAPAYTCIQTYQTQPTRTPNQQKRMTTTTTTTTTKKHTQATLIFPACLSHKPQVTRSQMTQPVHKRPSPKNHLPPPD
ncbi:hypothetical protein BP00DRAFT_69952 [Aspergillus indologenus CBS 114.80]|uniref:Uncharacterized protein n=1 Tax=Aspergillus indologenus CBS 114.80 TaxID=1450541 RepID=A0A2V5HVT3_9EURO|nr:hypothetical protein BP00DRAFT_69952 [Aspergillus indologenus CBS 114.80]